MTDVGWLGRIRMSTLPIHKQQGSFYYYYYGSPDAVDRLGLVEVEEGVDQLADHVVKPRAEPPACHDGSLDLFTLEWWAFLLLGWWLMRLYIFYSLF